MCSFDNRTAHVTNGKIISVLEFQSSKQFLLEVELINSENPTILKYIVQNTHCTIKDNSCDAWEHMRSLSEQSN